MLLVGLEAEKKYAATIIAAKIRFAHRNLRSHLSQDVFVIL